MSHTNTYIIANTFQHTEVAHQTRQLSMFTRMYEPEQNNVAETIVLWSVRVCVTEGVCVRECVCV